MDSLALPALARRGAVALAVLLAALACAAPALASHAGHIDGSPLDFSADANGQVQAAYDPGGAGLFFPPSRETPANSGLHVRVYDGVGGSTLYGFLGQPFSGATVDPPTGDGSASTPYTLETTFFAGGLQIRQVAEYVNGSDTVSMTYDVTNTETGGPLRFRAWVAGDFYAGSDGGVGYVEAGTPRRFGGINDHYGLSVELGEVTSGSFPSPWTHFREGGYSSVFSDISSDTPFSDEVDPAYLDNGGGIQWDDYATSGLAPDTSDTFRVDWTFPRFHAISFSEFVTFLAAFAGDTLHVPVFTFFGGQGESRTVCWSRSGVNNDSGQITTDSGGNAVLALTSQQPGDDVLTAFSDVDGGGCGARGAGEPQRQLTISWVAQPVAIALDPATATRNVGETHSVNVFVASDPAAPVRYAVTGANPGAGTAAIDPSTHQGTISWIGANAGTDVLAAFHDRDGDGVQSADEPAATATVEWQGARPPRTIDELPNPRPFREVNVEPVRGIVTVKLPGSEARKGFVPLSEAAQIPTGSILNTRRGAVKLEAAADRRGRRTQTATFDSGQFQVVQRRASKPVTEMVLKGGSFSRCRARRASDGQAQSSRRRRVRRVWGNGRGRFRTRGRYSSATVRGTKWLVEDYCEGTLTRVTRGKVQVRDFTNRRNVDVRAGRSYFARARRR